MKRAALACLVFATFFITACRDKKEDPTPESDLPLSINLEMSHIVWVGKDSLFGNDGWTGSAILIDFQDKRVQVDSVSLNGTNLKYDSINQQYSSEILDTSKCIWALKGKNGVPDFNYANTVGMPVYTGYDQLPDSIDISKDLVVPLSGMVNADNFGISIYSYTGVFATSSFMQAGTSSFTFKSSEFSNFQKGEYAYLTVGIYRENDQHIGNTSFFLHNSLITYKVVKFY